MKKISLILSVLLLSSISLTAQVKVALHLDTERPTFVWQYLFCDERFNCGLRPGEKQKQETFAGTLIRVERQGDGFRIFVDTNGRRGLSDEKPIYLASGKTAIVTIKRQVAPGQFLLLPYELSNEPNDSKGDLVQSFSIRPHYILSGTFRSGQCSLYFGLNDMNGDGKMNRLDGGRGSNIQIDRNHDQKFWGKDEFSSTNEILEMCGHNYLIHSISFSGITFSPTTLKLAKVGEKVVDFSFNLLNGSIVSSESTKGRTYVLDFWASWCGPCVDNLPEVKKLRDELRGSVDVFSVNVDKPSRKTVAEKIVQENQLSEFASIRGMGSNDRLWKSFGGANLNRLAIPLYVMVDSAGVVRYAGNGGDRLSELKAIINSTKSNGNQ